MLKSYALILIGLVLLGALAGCHQQAGSLSNSTSEIPPQATAALTENRVPWDTPNPPPSTTATFMPATAPTATGAPAAMCPNIPINLSAPAFITPKDGANPLFFISEQEILAYLNTHGLATFLAQNKNLDDARWINGIQAYTDLTNDTVPELVFGRGNFFIIGCLNNQFVVLYQDAPNAYQRAAEVIQIVDANGNGIPEITLRTGQKTQGGHSFRIIEWTGSQFDSLLLRPESAPGQSDEISVNATGEIGVQDIDHDGRLEYVVSIGIPTGETYQLFIPWRDEHNYYNWNGSRFVLSETVFSPPQYRIQAVHDADRASMRGDFNLALSLYQQAINDPELEWWVPEKRAGLIQAFFNSQSDMSTFPTPTALQPDPAEYDHLAAYAYYRIMLVYIAQGRLSDAQATYTQLRQKFPSDTAGSIYGLLAERFWNAYSTTPDMAAACTLTLEFVAHNKDAVFDYINGRDYYSPRRIDYFNGTDYICPFNQ